MNSISMFRRDFNRAMRQKDSCAAIDVKRSSVEIYADNYEYVPSSGLIVLFRQGTITATVNLSDVDKVVDFQDWRVR